MDTDDFWKRIYNKDKTHLYCWFDKTLEESVIITHWLYHHLDGYNQTVFILTEQSVKGKYTVIAVLSIEKLSKKGIMKYLNKVPSFVDDSWTGGR